MTKVLLAAEMPLCGLYRRVSKQKLNLLNLAAMAVAELRTGSAKVMRSDM